VTVNPGSASFTALGETARFTAEVRDQNGQPMAGAAVAWASSDASVATVDAGGLVTAEGNGAAAITARAGSASGSASVTVMENPDRAALVALYEATDGPNWVDNTNWLTDAPLGEWYGVDTDASGRVWRLNLSGRYSNEESRWVRHGLSGHIPPELGNLSSLRLLLLYGNQLTGPIPPELGNLSNLTELWLFENQLTGPIPPELGNAARLTKILLLDNRLTGPIPSELGNLSELSVLGLCCNPLGGEIPPWLADLSSLEGLDLAGTQLTGPIPPELGELSHLTSLTLDGNQLTGRIPPELGKLANLTRLNLHRNQLTGPIPPELGKLANLTRLNLFENQLTGPILPELGNLSSLKSLAISINSLTGPIPRELGNLTDLERLLLGLNRLAGPIPAELGNLTDLTFLYLADNPNLVGPLPSTLAALTSLERLLVWNTGLCVPQTTEFDVWLQGIRQVAGDIEDCPVQSSDREALAAIHEWTNGDGWRNSENWLGDGPLDDWYGVTADAEDRVTALNLSDNNLSGILPVEAAGLLGLEELVLNDNNGLGGELPGEILRLVSLSMLRLDGTGVCASAAEVFRDWLDRISDARVMACPDDHGNDAADATSVSLGGRAEGEIESYADEDWFRIELGGQGSLSVEAEGSTVVSGELYDADGSLVGYDGSFGSFSILRRLPPGTYFVRVVGGTEDTRGPYELVSSFEPRTPGARAYLTQAVQSHDFAVPLVAGEDALLRVFVMADDGVTASMPPVRATFYRGGGEVHSVGIDGSSAPVPHTMAEDDLDATANAVVPGAVIAPGTEMVVEVDPDGTLDPSLGIGGRIPAEGRMALDIRDALDFDVTAVPFLWTENPDSSGYKVAQELTPDHELFYETRDWLPVAGMEVSVREAVLVDYDPKENMGRVLDDVALLHATDGAAGYYMGVPPWIERGVLGIARIGTRYSVSRLDGHTIAHEFGHNFSLRHAPCGGPAGVDGRYPHVGGEIGAWGYDFTDASLVDPEVFTDLMTYCRDDDWISDYSFARAADYRTGTAAAMASRGARQVLLVRGGVEGGRLQIEPAFVLDAPPTLPERAGPYRLVGSDAQGGELFALGFDMQEIADIESEDDGGFTFAIPVRPGWAEALATITLAGPEGRVTLAGDDPASPATALVLDAATGRIRAILRNPPSATQAASVVAGGPEGTGLEVLVSRGIPDADAWRR